MTYLLDTDTLVFFLRGRAEVREKLLSTPLDDLFTSSVCIGELHYGAAKSQASAERQRAVGELQRLLRVVPFAEPEAARFGLLKATLEASGERLADADLMIAATALEHGLTVVSGNLRHFRRVGGLRLESWIDRGGASGG